jgi:hypothetical protein
MTPATQNNAQTSLSHFLVNPKRRKKTAAEKAKPQVASQGRIHMSAHFPTNESASPGSGASLIERFGVV